MTPTSPLTPDIETESDYQKALEAMRQRQRPAGILRVMMNALEKYRQARKIGWSRPQNKYGLTVFRAYKLDACEYRELAESVFAAVSAEFSGLPAEHENFIQSLKHDRELMFYVFVHDHEDRSDRYEGVTFSLGRRAANLPRHRDRLDVIIESPVQQGRSQGPSRIRMYVDPFRRPIAENPALQCGHDPLRSRHSRQLFDAGVELYASIPAADRRVWSHWTRDYIDYFGPRLAPVRNSYFPTEVDEARAAVG
ncbi:MAG TPA: hypothetical protein VFQ61_01790 [Polyangiaceae bacterium]|nr:hypothetical protein [Polyangiaceae bacterium]